VALAVLDDLLEDADRLAGEARRDHWMSWRARCFSESATGMRELLALGAWVSCLYGGRCEEDCLAQDWHVQRAREGVV
jgi:hypothetical protein